MSRPLSFIAGAMCGALVGGVAALLLAPSSGLELRSEARERVDRLIDEAREAARARQAQLEAQLAALRAPRAAE